MIELLINRYDLLRLKAAIIQTEKDQGEGAVVLFRQSLQELAETLLPAGEHADMPVYYQRLLLAWASSLDAAADRLRAAAGGGPVFSPGLLQGRNAARQERVARVRRTKRDT